MHKRTVRGTDSENLLAPGDDARQLEITYLTMNRGIDDRKSVGSADQSDRSHDHPPIDNLRQ